MKSKKKIIMEIKISHKPTPDNKAKPWRLETPNVIIYYATETEAIKAKNSYAGRFS